MKLNDQQLTQIDDEYIEKLVNHDIEALANLAIMLASDLKESRERLNLSPSNSSTPSGSLAPWDKGLPNNESSLGQKETEGEGVNSDDVAPTSDLENNTDKSNDANAASPENTESDPGDPKKKTTRKPGRQMGSQGFGRTQQLWVTDTDHHRCGDCHICSEPLRAIEKAADLMTDICQREGVQANQVTLHSDNGSPMKGATMLATLQQLGVIPSFSRPPVSHDNPYSESLFRTLKYRPEYPEQAFSTLAVARDWVHVFVNWYNTEHLLAPLNLSRLSNVMQVRMTKY